jgi:hypothetical protein
LYLPEGSSIVFVNGGNLNPAGGTTGAGCTGNDRVYIGGVLMATCQGGSGLLGFDELITLGGTGSVTSNSPVCVGNSINLSATSSPNGGPYTYSWSGPNGFSSTSQNPIIVNPLIAAAGIYKVKMTSTTLSPNISIEVQTTVVVNSSSTTAAPTVTVIQPTCSVSTGNITITAPLGFGIKYSINDLTYTNTSVFTTLVPGTYNVTAKNSSGCISSVTSVIINAQPLTPSIPIVGTITHPTCIVGTGSVVLSGLPASGTINQTGTVTNSYTITGTTMTISGLAPGTYNFAVSNGTCTSSLSSNVTINTQPLTPSMPIVGTITHATCVVGTGSVVLSGLPVSGTINQTGLVINSYTITGTTMTISGLAPGTYNFAVSNGTCTSSLSSNVVVNASITKTWGGSSWSPSAPTINDRIIFNGDYIPYPVVNVEGCSCQVNSGTVVTIESGATLKIANEVTVLGTGILKFEIDASLIQINDAAINSGNIKYDRHTAPIIKTDYTYWSSPVSPQKLIDVSPETLSSMFYSFNATGNYWKRENTANLMNKGVGYIIRGPESFTAPNPTFGIHLATFIGVPNNGVITTPIGGANTSNLIGNPYPSAIDADLFLDANSALLEGNLYFWTHATEIQLRSMVNNPGSGDYAYTSDDYATYNRTGGVGTTATTTGNIFDGTEDSGNKPKGKIAAGQGFFATGIAAGNAVFNNSMRVSGGTFGVNNAQFFKSVKNSKEKITIEKHRVWLNLTNDKGAFKQTLVGYVTKATNGYDKAFDAESFNANKYVNFYSVNENKKLSIQGRTLPFDENDEVPLGYSSTIKGVFSIAIDEADGLLASKDVFLEDKLTNVVKNLKEGAYSFSTGTGTFNDRFVLRYVNTNKTLGNDDFKTLENTVLVSKDKNELKIKSQLENIERITIFDLLGRKVFDKEAIESNEFHFSNSTLNKQTIIVKVTLTTGAVISKKVIY